MITAAGDAVLAGCSALAGACAALDHVRVLLSMSLDALIERDRSATPVPSRAVLVLNDDPAGLDTMQRILAPLGVPVILAATAREARGALDSRQPPCAIVADYYLGPGETCAALLRDRRPRTRAVIVTGAVDTARIESIARGVGADLRDVPITLEAQDALCALVASYLPPETP